MVESGRYYKFWQLTTATDKPYLLMKLWWRLGATRQVMAAREGGVSICISTDPWEVADVVHASTLIEEDRGRPAAVGP